MIFSMTKKTPDHAWLKEIGVRGWIGITGDIAIEKSYSFLSQLLETNSHVFILCNLNHATREGRAECVISAYEQILKVSSDVPGPQLWKSTKPSEILRVDFVRAR